MSATPFRTRRRLLRLTALGVIAALAASACSGDDESASTTAAPASSAATTAAVTTEAPTTTGAPPVAATAFTLAYVEPAAGLLGDLATAQRRGMEDALNDMNAAGGVLGGSVAMTTITEPRSGDVGRTVTDAVSAGANAIVGPAGSTSATAMIPALEAAGMVACSGSATAPSLSTADTTGRLYRTAVSDEHLVAHIVDTLRQRLTDGGSVAVVARDDAYGVGVGAGLTVALTSQGIPATVIPYSSSTVLFADTAAAVAAAGAQQVVLVSYGEGAALLASLVKAGVATTSIIGLDGMFAPRLAAQAFPDDPTKADGVTIVGTTGARDYTASLVERNPNGQVVYAAQVYDCAVALALAAEASGSTDATTLAAQLAAVTSGGVACTTFADCISKLRAGEDIDFDGRSGTIGFDANGDPSSARFTSTVVAGGTLSETTTVDIDIAGQRQQAEYESAIASAGFTTNLQGKLTLLGFYKGPIDGIYDDEVIAAVAAFQTSVGLPATGQYDQATDEALRAKLGSGAATISQATADLQLLLTQLGLYRGPIDGIYSQAVIDAVKALQAALGVPQTGVIDVATLKAAYEQGLATQPEPPAPSTTTVPPPPTTEPPVTLPDSPDIVDTLASDPRFTTVAGLIIIAGLRDELTQPGPFTIFAPTNDAFAAAGPEVLAALISDPQALRSLLLYHVVPGQRDSGSLTDGTLPTLSGAGLGISRTDAVRVNGVAVIVPDIRAGNGIIHGIEAVLSPATPL